LKGVPLLLEEEAERSEDNVATLLLLSTEEQASRAANDSPAFAADDFLSMPACTIAPAHSARERERERERDASRRGRRITLGEISGARRGAIECSNVSHPKQTRKWR